MEPFKAFARITSAGLLCAALSACAAQRPLTDNSGLRVVSSSPAEFCRGTARSIAVGRYDMRQEGMPLEVALQQNEGVALIDAITRAVYAANVHSEDQAADVGTSACLRYFS